MKIFLLALTSIWMSVAAQFTLKAGMAQSEMQKVFLQRQFLQALPALMTNIFIVGGLLLYGLGAVVWLSVLARWDVSKAYPLVGLGFGFSLVVGMLLGEQVTLWRALGVGLICIGAILVGRS